MTQYKGVLDISNSGQGFKEIYYFPSSVTSTDALTKLKQICWGRTAFFAAGTTLIFARVSEIGPAHDGLSVQLPYPVGPHPSWSSTPGGPVGDTLSTVNDLKACIQMRFETAAGMFYSRYLRLIPDTWVVGNQLPDGCRPYLQQLPGGAAVGDMSPAGGLSHLVVCQTFWSYLQLNTQFKHNPKGGPVTYMAFDFSSYRKISSRKIGRFFGQLAGRISTFS